MNSFVYAYSELSCLFLMVSPGNIFGKLSTATLGDEIKGCHQNRHYTAIGACKFPLLGSFLTKYEDLKGNT